MKTVFFTFVSDDYYYSAGTHVMVNSFKKFHPEIDLVVFRQNTINRVFSEHKGLNFYNAKPTFAKLLTKEYDLIVNIDADTVITGRLDEVLEGDYDLGAVWNYNKFENASLEGVDEKMYVQAGMVASTKTRFWDRWEEANKDAMKYVRKENDVLNLVWYKDNLVKRMKHKIFDIDKNYLGCKSLGLEAEMYIYQDKLFLNGEEVKAYHHAKGDVRPKLIFERMGFTPQVTTWLQHIGYDGVSVKYVEAV